MKISERTVKRLGEIITGDKSLSPYRSGPKLVNFFNDFGTNHTYGDGFHHDGSPPKTACASSTPRRD
jgi:hypothetical protein